MKPVKAYIGGVLSSTGVSVITTQQMIDGKRVQSKEVFPRYGRDLTPPKFLGIVEEDNNYEQKNRTKGKRVT